MKALLSIKPQFAEKIFSGEKKFEYRKVVFAQKNVKTIVVYATMPVGKIIGEFSFDEILELTPSELWAKTKDFSGVEKQFYDKYFEGRTKAFAIKIKKVTLYETPINPYDSKEKFTPPQSFSYIKNRFKQDLEKLVNVHFTQVSRYERGETKPNAEAMTRLAKVLDTTVDFLMNGTTDDVVQNAGLEKELISRFKDVQDLNQEDKKVVLSLMDAFIAKTKIQSLLAKAG